MITLPALGSAPDAARQALDFTRVPSASLPLAPAEPDPLCELSVAIPVHNEEAGIAATLAALAAQVDQTGRPLDPRRYEVLVLANNCTDGTVEQARRFAAATPALRLHVIEILLPPPHAHVGAARRLVMDEACRRLGSLGRQRGVIATTDGDTLVRPTWVASNLEEIAHGADAVGGRILATPEEIAALDPGTRLYYRRDTAYRTLRTAYESILNPDPANAWPRHHHCFGASLAVTVQAYLAAGGLPVVHCLEDMAFVRELERRDARVRRSPAVNVLTSLRCSGRVDVGLSWTLSKWTRAAALGEPLLLESPDAIAWEALNRRCLRQLWERKRTSAAVAQASASVGMRMRRLNQFWRAADTAGEFCQSVCEDQRRTRTGPWSLPLMEAQVANTILRRRLAALRHNLRAVTIIPARKGRAGSVPPGSRFYEGAGHPWTPPRETLREPRRLSTGSHGREASSEPVAGAHAVLAG